MTAVARAVLLPAVAAFAAGCASPSESVPPSVPAPPQKAELHWVERTPTNAPGLVFEVQRFAVTDGGWHADVAIRNDSPVAWSLVRSAPAMFGLMLFETGGLDELDRRNRDRELPGLRRARLIRPSLPPELQPGDRWEGRISAPGALAAGRWVRLVFGTLGTADPPPGLPNQLVWITDRAHELRR